jgi:hypothetical protein
VSLPVEYLVTDAAMAFGDPKKERVDDSDWLRHYNTAIRDVCSHWDVLEHKAFFNLEPGIDAYGFPTDMVRLSELAVTTTPEDEDTFDDLGEIQSKEEFRNYVRRSYPTGTPELYYARRNWYQMVPKPDVEVIRGGRIYYYGMPDRVFTLPNALYQLPEFTQNTTIERMVIAALNQDERVTEAERRYTKWLAEGPFIEDRMQDRSVDKRENMRPDDNPYGGMS